MKHTLFAITIHSTAQDELQKAAQFYWVRVLSDPDEIREWEVRDLLGQDLRNGGWGGVEREKGERNREYLTLAYSNSSTLTA